MSARGAVLKRAPAKRGSVAAGVVRAADDAADDVTTAATIAALATGMRAARKPKSGAASPPTSAIVATSGIAAKDANDEKRESN
jgi:hypothetical protein